ncbi:hypothetical protein BDK51DRAFT_28173, partial [Blyttiomyces helicus]
MNRWTVRQQSTCESELVSVSHHSPPTVKISHLWLEPTAVTDFLLGTVSARKNALMRMYLYRAAADIQVYFDWWNDEESHLRREYGKHADEYYDVVEHSFAASHKFSEASDLC